MTTKTNKISGILALGVLSLAGSAFAQEASSSEGTALGSGGEVPTQASVTATATSGEEGAPTTADSRAEVASEPVPKVASAEPARTDGKSQPKDEADLPVWERSPKIEVGGYVHSAFIMNSADGKVDNEFRLRKARVQVNWSQGKLLDGSIEFDLAQEIDSEEEEAGSDNSSPTWAPLRDAYVEVTPLKAIGVRMGQFKRPFSRLALTSSRKLKLVSRGVSDAWINGELKYGDRDVGAQIQGEFGKNWGLDYAIGVFNGTGSNARETDAKGAKDIVGRVVGHLGKHIEVGVNVAAKSWDDPPATVSYTTNAFMYGGDVEVDYKGFGAVLEGGYGDFYTTFEQDTSYYVLGLLSYEIHLMDAWKLSLEPLIKGELLVPRKSESESRVLAGTVGANLHVGDRLRLMVQGDLIAPNDEARLPLDLGEAESLKRLTVQVALHTK